MFPNTTIPEPTDFFFPRWNSNPLFRGSYSNVPAAFVPAHQDNIRATVNKTLWFAGEATSFKYYGEHQIVVPRKRSCLKRFVGFLHGAYFEGLDNANKLADCIEAGGCDGLPHVELVPEPLA